MTDSSAGTLPLPPGDLGFPVLGETVAFLKDTTTFLESRFKKHGPIWKTRLFNTPIVCMGGHEAFSRFMDERYFTRAGASPGQLQELLNPNALPFIDGDEHKKRKRLILKAFEPQPLETYLPILEKLYDRFLARWEEKAKAGPFVWVPELDALSFAIVDAVFAGADPSKDNEAIAAHFRAASAGMLAVPVPLPFTTYGKALSARDALLAYVNGVIADHRAKPRADLLSQLMSARDAAGDALTDRELGIELLHFYFAGLPLLSALAYHLMLLAQNPDVMKRAAGEVASVAPKGPITMDVVGKLPYVHQACLESRRHSAVVGLTFFATVKEAFDFKGHHVPAGWKAFGLIGCTMKDEGTFTTPAKYDPDRFGPERKEHCRYANAYVAQGGGPEDGHRCAAEKLVHVVMSSLTARLLRDFVWELPEQNLAPTVGKISATPVDGLKVVMKRRG
jgi:cytochrome P450